MQEISGSLSEVIRAYSDHNLLVPAATDVQLKTDGAGSGEDTMREITGKKISDFCCGAGTATDKSNVFSAYIRSREQAEISFGQNFRDKTAGGIYEEFRLP